MTAESLSAEQKTARDAWRAGRRKVERLQTPTKSASVSLPPPVCPSRLTETAEREWQRLIPLLIRSSRVCGLDEGLLAGYCEAFAELQEASVALATEGRTVKTPSGFIRRHPSIVIRDAAFKRMLQAAKELGISPLARGRRESAP